MSADRESMEKQMTALLNQVLHLSAKLDLFKEQLAAQGDEILQQAQQAAQEEKPQGLYRRQGEKHRFKKMFADFSLDDPRIPQMLHGLDAKSGETVIRIINRIQALRENDYADMDLFTTEEKRQLAELAEDLRHGVLKIRDDLYAYRHYFLPIGTFEASVFYNNQSLETLRHPERIAGRNIVDVGAFIGDSALVFQSLNAARIYSFEAVPDNYELLKKTIALNGASNVEPVLLALGAQREQMEIAVNGILSAFDSLFKYEKTAMIQVDTLDNYAAENGLDDIALIKVDIEGHERHFLNGALETIKKHRPALMLSIYHNWDDFIGIKPFLESLDLGYRFRVAKPIDDGIVTETLLFAETD